MRMSGINMVRRVMIGLSLIGAVAVMTGILFTSGDGAVLADGTETSFTIAEIPDTQQEVLADSNTLLSSRYQWLIDNQQSMNLKFIAHTGDVVNWGVVDPLQFIRASAATTILDNSGVQFGYAIGNHDGAAVQAGGSAAPGNVHDNLRNTELFNQYFPLSRFHNVVGTYELNKVDNMYQTFTAGGMNWLVITHEMWPRAGAIDWMKQVVAAYPNHNVIINTHAFIDNDGALPTAGNYGDTNALVEWDSFISQYPNIKIVISGHYGPKNGVGGYYYKEATGVNGNKIAQIMTAYHSNYQNHVRLLNIDTANSTISSSVYVNQSLDPINYPTGYVSDWASNFVTTSMNWIKPDGTGTQDQPPIANIAPTAPLSVVAVGGINSATVSFAPPTNDGGTPVTGYRVISNTGQVLATGVASPINITGLTAGTSYTFTVVATNAVGDSPASEQSNSIVPTAPSPELLSDPGFETGLSGWKAFDTGVLTRVTSPINTGSYALSITRQSTAVQKTGLTLNDTIKNSVAGTTYEASCYVRPSVAGLSLTMRFLEYTQNYSSSIKFATDVNISSLSANAWTKVTVRATAVKSGERMIPQIYSANQYKSSGAIVYDTCSVKVVPAGQ